MYMIYILNPLMSSSALLNKPYPLTAYAANPSSTRSKSDQRRSYVRGGSDWRQYVTFSLGPYGISRLMPSSTSDL